MIKEISNQEGKDFLIKNKAYKEHISITDAEFWLGYFDNEKLVGVISKITLGKTSRIKEFYTLKDFRGKGIGTSLLEEMLKNCDKSVSSFATNDSYSLFKKAGFNEKKKKEITFMRRKYE